MRKCFIADFVASAQRLVVEVDGVYHAERARAGYIVLRLDEAPVVRDIEAAVSRVRATLRV